METTYYLSKTQKNKTLHTREEGLKKRKVFLMWCNNFIRDNDVNNVKIIESKLSELKINKSLFVYCKRMGYIKIDEKGNFKPNFPNYDWDYLTRELNKFEAKQRVHYRDEKIKKSILISMNPEPSLLDRIVVLENKINKLFQYIGLNANA